MIYALYISSVRSQTVLVLPYFLNNKYIKCCTAYGTGGCSTQDHQGCGKLPSFLSQWVIKISIVRLYYFKASPLPLLYHPRHSFSLYSPIIDPLFPSFARRLCLRSSNKKNTTYLVIKTLYGFLSFSAQLRLLSREGRRRGEGLLPTHLTNGNSSSSFCLVWMCIAAPPSSPSAQISARQQEPLEGWLRNKNMFVEAQVVRVTFCRSCMFSIVVSGCVFSLFLHADCMLAAGPLQIKPGLLRGWGLGGWWADIAFL